MAMSISPSDAFALTTSSEHFLVKYDLKASAFWSLFENDKETDEDAEYSQ